MTKGRIKITYDIITPESAERGDFAESGWENEEGLGFENISDVIEFLTSRVLEDGGDGHSYYSVDPETDYRTGESNFYAYHLEGFTEEEMEDITRGYELCIEGNRKQCKEYLGEIKEKYRKKKYQMKW